MNTPNKKVVRFNKSYYFDIESTQMTERPGGYIREWHGDNPELRNAYQSIENISNWYQAKLLNCEILCNSQKEVYTESYTDDLNHGWGMAYSYGNSYPVTLVAYFEYEAEVNADQYQDVISLFKKVYELEQKVKKSNQAVLSVNPAISEYEIREIQKIAESEIVVEKTGIFSSRYILSKTKKEFSHEDNAKRAIEQAKIQLRELDLDSVNDATSQLDQMKRELQQVQEEINQHLKVYWG